MNKLVVRGFIQWLDAANREEIETRRGEFLTALEHFQSAIDGGRETRKGTLMARRVLDLQAGVSTETSEVPP